MIVMPHHSTHGPSMALDSISVRVSGASTGSGRRDAHALTRSREFARLRRELREGEGGVEACCLARAVITRATPQSCGVGAKLPGDLAEGQPMIVVEVGDQTELVVDRQKRAALGAAD